MHPRGARGVGHPCRRPGVPGQPAVAVPRVAHARVPRAGARPATSTDTHARRHRDPRAALVQPRRARCAALGEIMPARAAPRSPARSSRTGTAARSTTAAGVSDGRPSLLAGARRRAAPGGRAPARPGLRARRRRHRQDPRHHAPHRVRRRDRASTPPDRVLALTFTTRAAGELRTRLRGARRRRRARRARSTPRRSRSSLLLAAPSSAAAVPRSSTARRACSAHAAESLGIRVDTATLRDAAAEIEWRKVTRPDARRLRGARAPAARPGSRRSGWSTCSSAYEQIKDERRQLDFEDVLLATAGMIESRAARRRSRCAQQYRFFVVDEYQDVSPLQHELLDLWLGDRNDLCVVGDASQTIYSFAGARPRLPAGLPARVRACGRAAARAQLPLEPRDRRQPRTRSCAAAPVRCRSSPTRMRRATAPRR